jgi:hypothetical protein
MLAVVKNWYQILSWRLGYSCGQNGHAHRCPWWADNDIYSIAYIEGQGGARRDSNEKPGHESG